MMFTFEKRSHLYDVRIHPSDTAVSWSGGADGTILLLLGLLSTPGAAPGQGAPTVRRPLQARPSGPGPILSPSHTA